MYHKYNCFDDIMHLFRIIDNLTLHLFYTLLPQVCNYNKLHYVENMVHKYVTQTSQLVLSAKSYYFFNFDASNASICVEQL